MTSQQIGEKMEEITTSWSESTPKLKKYMEQMKQAWTSSRPKR
jgi:hypothetical protein